MTRLSSRARLALVVVVIFAALTLVMTWPQARVFGSDAFPHQDVYFNMWRLEWVAHAIATRTPQIFDANIFYPERRTLALSDAMLVQGFIAAPLIWIGLSPVVVHNVMLLGAIAMSGAAMFALVLYLTRSRGAAFLAGIVFAFAPYRFEHIMHMELQWAMWAPLAFLAFHRTLDTGRLGPGLLTGAFVALQMLSSIYYGVFLLTLLGLGGVLMLAFDRRVALRRALVPLVAGGVAALTISAAYAVPYLRVRESVGERPIEQVHMFSARPSSYLIATPTNWIYGDVLQSRGRGELRLFPGLVIVVLAVIGLLLKPPPVRAIIYLLALVGAFEASLGLRGHVYRFLFDYVPVYRGLRAPARLGIFVVMFLGVLGAYGYTALVESLRPAARRVIFAVLAGALLVEYSATMTLTSYPAKAPALYRYLAQLPPGVVAEFPVPRPESLPGFDAEYSYFSVFHWHPIVNGYSGAYPPSYLMRLERLRHFPDERSRRQLRHDGVRYVVVHEGKYANGGGNKILAEVAHAGEFRYEGSFEDSQGVAHVYTFR